MYKGISTFLIFTLVIAASADGSALSAVDFLSAGNTTYQVYFRKESLIQRGPPEILKCKEGILKIDSLDQPAPFQYIAYLPIQFTASNFKLNANIVTKLRPDGQIADFELNAYYMPTNAAVGSTLVNMRVENQKADFNISLTADGRVSEDQHSNSFVTANPEMPNYVAVMNLNPSQTCEELLTKYRKKR